MCRAICGVSTALQTMSAAQLFSMLPSPMGLSLYVLAMSLKMDRHQEYASIRMDSASGLVGLLCVVLRFTGQFGDRTSSVVCYFFLTLSFTFSLPFPPSLPPSLPSSLPILPECLSWLISCNSTWQCGSAYEYRVYQSVSFSQSPCPDYSPSFMLPTEPGVCEFNMKQYQCMFRGPRKFSDVTQCTVEV